MTSMSASPNWHVWTQQGWDVSFRYPPTDGSGQPVTVDRGDQQHSGLQRVHVMADNRDEVYFEVVRAPGVDADGFFATMRERLPELYPDVEFGPLSPRGEWQCGTFAWADQERVVCFAERPGATYRVIYRPLSKVNHAMWDTVEIR